MTMTATNDNPTSKIVRVLSASHERFSITFGDGLVGSIAWAKALEGSGITAGLARLESIRPSEDGLRLLVDYYYKPSENAPQQADKTVEITAEKIYALALESDKLTRAFQVDGQFGPTMLAFVFIGRSKGFAGSDQEARCLDLLDVQEWYTARGWPKSGCLTAVDRRGRVKAVWQLV